MSAIFSKDYIYRYSLTREWAKGEKVVFIGLNPSTANEKIDDPTIRRCTGFAKSWGFSGLVMVNLFAYRATKPSDMKLAEDPIGKHNHAILSLYGDHFAIACWGVSGSFMNQDQKVFKMFNNLHYLDLNQNGSPKHFLYLKKDLKPKPYLEQFSAYENSF